MAQLCTNPPRSGPYKNFKFRIKLDATFVAGANKVSALTEGPDLADYRKGGDPGAVHLLPDLSSYDAIMLEQGITDDTDFEEWLNKAQTLSFGDSAEDAAKDCRRDVIVEVYNEAGQAVLTCKFFRCWVSEYQALPKPNAGPVQ